MGKKNLDPNPSSLPHILIMSCPLCKLIQNKLSDIFELRIII